MVWYTIYISNKKVSSNDNKNFREALSIWEAFFARRPRQPTNTHYKTPNIENEYSSAIVPSSGENPVYASINRLIALNDDHWSTKKIFGRGQPYWEDNPCDAIKVIASVLAWGPYRTHYGNWSIFWHKKSEYLSPLLSFGPFFANHNADPLQVFYLFPSAPEEYFGLQPSCHPLPYQLGGLGRQDGGLRERWPITQRQWHAPSVLYTREDATAWIDAGQLHGLHVIILRLSWRTGSSSYLYLHTRHHHKHWLDEEAMDAPT